MTTTLSFMLSIATPQAIAVAPVPENQALSNVNLIAEQPNLAATQRPGLTISTTDLSSTDKLLNTKSSTPELPTIDVDPAQPDPTPPPALDPANLESWFLDSQSGVSLDPSPTNLEPGWIEITDWLEPHGWWPAPTYLMPAPMFGFPILDEGRVDGNEDSPNTLPTAMPESMLGPTSPEIIGAGTVVDRTYDWAFFDQGDVAVNGVILSPKDGSLTRWLPGDTTYVGLFNDGLMIGPHLIPYPAEYREWMREHNIVVWK